jgi:MoxR-like ATPase
MLLQASRAYALLRGRSYVVDQDIIEMAPLVLAHRIKMKDVRLFAEDLLRERVLAIMKGRDGS